jgi:hypothetical protein
MTLTTMDSGWAPPRPGEIQDLGGSRLGEPLERLILQSFAGHSELPKESAYNDEGCLRWLDASSQPGWYQTVEEKSFLCENAQELTQDVLDGAVVLDMGAA